MQILLAIILGDAPGITCNNQIFTETEDINLPAPALAGNESGH